jgi:virginiamycin A acetyltransferase
MIGNDVWIGYDAFIRDGVKIEDGAIVASKSVVANDVPAYAIVAGNPARVVRLRFSDKEIDTLLKLEWWSLGDDCLKDNVEVFYSRDVQRLVSMEGRVRAQVAPD